REANQREQEARQREVEARGREEEAKLAAEQARVAAREAIQRDQTSNEREKEVKRREEEARRLAEETKRVTLEAQKCEEEAKAREKETRRREEEAVKAAANAQEREQQAKKELERSNGYLSKGIQPEVWPTEEEFQSVKTRIQYDPQKLHFAICGSSGSGKSSLINAFRGVKNFEPGAAPTGVTETTTSVTRYPDPHDKLPHSRFIWFDVPGAGTLNIPGWQYFNEQGLFIFDIIILVYDARFTQLDVAVVQHCERYHIPLFIVRSKADVQIKNVLGDQFGYDEVDEDAAKKYKEHHSDARQLLIDSTRKDFDRNLEKANLAKREVFIISSNSMYALMTEKWNWRNTANVIDEANLLQAVLKAALTRR
ncbi:P-loop containing nucleoside triphosphate hydrolase protein, partial [Phlegmacium glaucopus]